MHPREGNRYQHKDAEERGAGETRPGFGVCEKRRQDKTTQATEHAYQAAHGPHIVREIVGYMLIDGGLTETHGAAQNKHKEHEERQRNLIEHEIGFTAVRVINGDMTIGHGENPTGNQHDPKGGIHDPSRTPPIRHPAAQGPQQGCRENIGSRQQACGGETHIKIIHVIFWQPGGKRHIGAEDGHIIE